MSEEIREYIYSTFGERYFAKGEEDGVPAMAQNRRRVVSIFILRETIAPMIDRSDDPEASISFVIRMGPEQEKEVIEIPARKFKSKEKLMGLKLCRAFKVIDPQYEYNSVRSISYLANPNSVIFGDSVVEGGDAGQAMLPSRILYSSSYSIRGRSEITKQLTHNSLSEMGTMWDRAKGENRTSLFNTEYIIPGVFFPSFITMINPTPESLVHVLLCLKERSYGAQTSITGPNIKNSIIAIHSGEEELPITSYTVSRSFDVNGDQDPAKLKESIIKFVVEKMNNEHSGKVVAGSEIEELLGRVDRFSNEDLQSIYNKLKADSQDLVKYAKILSEDRKKKPSLKKKGEEKEEEEENESL